MKRSHSSSYNGHNYQNIESNPQNNLLSQFQRSIQLRKKYLEEKERSMDKQKQSIIQIIDSKDPQTIQSYAQLKQSSKVSDIEAIKSQKFRFKGKYPSVNTIRVVQNQTQKIQDIKQRNTEQSVEMNSQSKQYEEQEDRAQTVRLRLAGQQKKEYDKQKFKLRENICKIQAEIKENQEHDNSVSSENTQLSSKKMLDQLRFYIETFSLSSKVDCSYPAEMQYMLNKLKDYIFFHWKSSLDLKEKILEITQNKQIKNFFLWVQPYHYPYNDVCRILLEEMISQNTEHVSQVEMLKDKIKELNDVGNGMRQKLNSIKQNIIYHKEKGVIFSGDASTLFKYDAYEEEISQLKSVQSKLENHILTQNEEILSLREEITQKDGKIKRQETQMDILKRNIKNLEDLIQTKDNNLAEKQKFLNEEKTKLKYDLDQLSENIDDLFQEIKDEFSKDSLKLKDTPQMDFFKKIFAIYKLSFEDVYRDVNNVYVMSSKELLKKLVQYFSSLLEWKADIMNVMMNNMESEKRHSQFNISQDMYNHNKSQHMYQQSQNQQNPNNSYSSQINQSFNNKSILINKNSGSQYINSKEQQEIEQQKKEQQHNLMIFQLKQIINRQQSHQKQQ